MELIKVAVLLLLYLFSEERVFAGGNRNAQIAGWSNYLSHLGGGGFCGDSVLVPR